MVPVERKQTKMDSSDDDAVAAAEMLGLFLKSKLDARKKRKTRAIWTKSWIGNRLSIGAYHALVQELRETDTQGFANFLFMDVESFEILLGRVAPLIARQDTDLRLSIQWNNNTNNVNKQLANHRHCLPPAAGAKIEHALSQNLVPVACHTRQFTGASWYAPATGTRNRSV